MPSTHNLQIKIDKQELEIGELANTGISMSYTLEDPEHFEQKKASMVLGMTVPATPVNDRIFNTFHNPAVEDLTADLVYSKPRSCSVIVNGIDLLTGRALLEQASHFRMPGGYTFSSYGQNGDWSIDAKDVTIWDCLSDTPHTFDVATIEDSWTLFDSDEDHDFSYVPVRYRQPFGANDDEVNIYHLRPSLSIYWLLTRFFRLLGYRIDSQFMNTENYFRRMVMPWTHGDFFDLNSQLLEAVLFKAAGPIGASPTLGFPAPIGIAEWIFFSGLALNPHPALDIDNTGWQPWNNGIGLGHTDAPSLAAGYIKSLVEHDSGGNIFYQNFRLNNTNTPNGFDNFSLYSFDEATGIMYYTFQPPAELEAYIGGSLGINFAMNLICKTFCSSGGSYTRIKIEWAINGGASTLEEILELTCGAGDIKGSLLYPTVHNFSIPGVAIGDVISMRLKYESDDIEDDNIILLSSCYVNVNPSATGANPWAYDFTTQKWKNLTYNASTTQWQPAFSSLQAVSLSIDLGDSVDFKLFDKFRSYKALDLLRGTIDAFNLSLQTDPINKVVTIEPTHDYVLPDGTVMPGYFKPERLDWTGKQDVNKENILQLFSDSERQYDFAFKGDGSDGGQNIYAARNKAIYLNNKVINPRNDTNLENGILSGIPGASRYMFPERFKQGTRQMTNRFFSATMHYNHTAWKGLSDPSYPAPQLITIIPENINDSSASAVTQTFEPKIAFYKGNYGIDPAVYGGWKWIGDPADPYTGATVTSFNLPLMFSVFYGYNGETEPVLSYGDQMINGNVVAGLMKSYFLKRMATMRAGKLYKAWMNLNLGDMIDLEHRNTIIIDGTLYHLIGIENYNPLSDSSALCTLWKATDPDQRDIDSCFPSADSLGGATILTQFDLKYGKLLLFNTDIPQVQ